LDVFKARQNAQKRSAVAPLVYVRKEGVHFPPLLIYILLIY
jgi:hypothetical protein